MPTRSNEQLCRLAQKGDTAARDILLKRIWDSSEKLRWSNTETWGWMKMILELIWMI